MTLGLMIAANQRFSADFTAGRDRILARSSGPMSDSAVFPNVLESRFATRTSFHDFRETWTAAAVARMTLVAAAMAFHAAAQLFPANATAEERAGQIRGTIVSLRGLTATTGHVDALWTFFARRPMTNHVARMTTAIEESGTNRLARYRHLLTEQ